jgi:dTDP-4-amino-4,6-dideoxygalactose transaminase
MPDQKKITVASPLLPPLDEFLPYLEDIWKRKWLTNNGYYHKKLEEALCEYLGVNYLSLFSNGTLALITALQALRISGEVITTPYSFVATTHSLWWNGIKPVFVDIDPVWFNLDPDRIEAAITPKTTAIMPVHVYGNPCAMDKIQEIADKYGLKVIYDAAHAFGVTIDGKTILNNGDLSILSFHATKTYTTIEGGAIVCPDEKTKIRIDYLKNFGFAGETTVVAPGINAKLDEVRAAFGILDLNYVDNAVTKRREFTILYRKALQNISGITFMHDMPGVKHNYSYFPIFVDEKKYGISRDLLYQKLKDQNIFGRRYFYPLISEFSTYRGLDSSKKENLPIAINVSNQIICLPMHHLICIEDINKIIQIIKS